MQNYMIWSKKWATRSFPSSKSIILFANLSKRSSNSKSITTAVTFRPHESRQVNSTTNGDHQSPSFTLFHLI